MINSINAKYSFFKEIIDLVTFKVSILLGAFQKLRGLTFFTV